MTERSGGCQLHRYFQALSLGSACAKEESGNGRPGNGGVNEGGKRHLSKNRSHFNGLNPVVFKPESGWNTWKKMPIPML